MLSPFSETTVAHALNETVLAGVKINTESLKNLVEQELRIADKIINLLELIGVRHIFGIHSYSNLPLYDALCNSTINVIIPKNEAGAAYSASKYAGASNDIGVCILAGTVGVNNGIGAIGEAFVNKHPVLIISGSPSRERIHRGGIQNLDSVSVTKPITKYSRLVETEEEVMHELYKAIGIATTPPFGPVHISIPVDIQNKVFSNARMFRLDAGKAPGYDRPALKKAIELINKEDSGVIYAGTPRIHLPLHFPHNPLNCRQTRR